MSQIVDKKHKQMAGRIKNVLATYQEAEDLINIGAYKAGSNKNIDFAISKIDSDELDKNTISQVFQKGYKIGDKIVRHAMVQVANCD